jgi:hypothetical protein
LISCPRLMPLAGLFCGVTLSTRSDQIMLRDVP